MAKALANLCKLNFHSSLLVNNIFKHGTPFLLPARNLYAQTTLGMDSYIHAREKINKQFTNLSDNFRVKMKEYITGDSTTNMIFTEDLKNMLHLAEANDEDVSLVVSMMKKFNQQNKELRFGSFVFGPVVMRMFHFLNKPDVALECFKNPEMEGFFDQLMTYQLLLDLLYENCKYNEVLETFDQIKSKQMQNTKYPRNIVVLTMAACYKLNTPESWNYASKLWSELQDVGHLPMRRAATFCAGLALNQGNSVAALEIITGIKKQNYMTVRNIKAAALADIGRADDLLRVLKSVIEIDDPNNPNNIKHTFCKDILNRAHAMIEKQDDPTIKQEFSRIEKYLKEQGHVNDITLDSHLCSEITAPPSILNDKRNDKRNPQKFIPRYQQFEQKKSNQNQQFEQKKSNQNQYKVYNQRPGLRDMY